MRRYNTSSYDTTPVRAETRVVQELSTTEPITLDEAKNYLRIGTTASDGTVSVTSDDALVTDFITAARRYAEKYLNTDLITKEREVYYNKIEQPISLYFGPLILTRNTEGVLTNFTVTRDNRDGTTTTLVENTDYFLDGLTDPVIDFDGNYAERITINYTTAGNTGDEINAGIKALVYKYYYNDNSPQSNWKPFLAPFRRFKFYGIA